MIVKNFTELDDDYITLMSKNLLENDASARAVQMEKLAELGQINAIQDYYLRNPAVVNPLIEKILDDNQSEDFEVLYAKALRSKNKELGETFSGLINSYNRVCREIEEVSFARVGSDTAKQNVEHRKMLLTRKGQLESQIFQYQFIALLNKSLTNCFQEYKKTGDPVILERFCEIALTNNHNHLFGETNKSALSHVLGVRKKLLEGLFRDHKNARNTFAFGRNLVTFSPEGVQKREGMRMLKSLAKRPCSKILNSYQLKGREKTN